MAKILVVDDAEFLRARISEVLTGEGHEIVEAENGLQAVETYKAVHPDAVIMDVAMPEMDGLAAFKEIRTFDPTAKVMMLSALGQESEVLEAIKSGARDFVLKPFERERMLIAISKLLD